MRTLLLIAVLVLVADARAQVCAGAGPLTVVPAVPDTRTTVTLRFLGLGESCSTLTYRIDGTVITVENVWQCASGLTTEPREVIIDPVPPGSYEVRVYDGANLGGARPLLACGSFTVTSVETIPALSPPAMLLLAALLCAFGVIVSGPAGPCGTRPH